MKSIAIDAFLWTVVICIVVLSILSGLTGFALYTLFSLPMNLVRVVRH